MGRHGSGVPLHKRLIPRLAENWRSLRRVSYMELVGSVAAGLVLMGLKRSTAFEHMQYLLDK